MRLIIIYDLGCFVVDVVVESYNALQYNSRIEVLYVLSETD